jgi:UDP-N-acetylmuramoyl-tripeptide--D-alanyl-D-alanine ligase
MSLMTLAQVHALLPGSRCVGDAATPIERVHTDTRSLRAGDLFVALKGERFDAHDFLTQATQAGAAAVLAERGSVATGVLVSDTQVALETLAHGWRQRFHLPLIGITGSNGKTTVTQMTASILQAWQGASALATQGNYNNHIGVPLTLLRLRQDDECWHRVAVIELGMNHPGEIARLAAMAMPTVALVNNAQREHQEFMSSVEAVARENGSVFAALPASGVAVFPANDPHTPIWRSLAGTRRTMTFGLKGEATSGADVQASGIWATQGATDHWSLSLSTPMGEIKTTLNVPGEHNLRNAAAAAACALAAGAPLDAVAAGLASFAAVKGRLQTHRLRRGGTDVVLVDDSYNANPDSVRAAIDVLASMPAPRWLVLGDMGEVGEQGDAFHAEVGQYARQRQIDQVWLAGDLCRHAASAHGAARHFKDAAAIVSALSEAPKAASILVKGSRFMAMERVVKALQLESDAC